MNKVTWAIQTNFIAVDQVTRIWEAAKAAGCAVQEVIVIPFSDDFGNEIPKMEGVIIPYGSTSLCRNAYRRKWKGNFFDKKTFRGDTWLKNRDDMLNSNCHFMKVKDTEKFFANADENEMWFIRPIKDLKEFNGTVTNVQEIRRWMKSTDSGNFSFTKNTEVMIAPVKKIQQEARFFVVDGKVIDGSWYRIHGQLFSQPINDQLFMDEVQLIADKWLPHKCCVMDIAISNDEIKVIEFNTINGSGFYYNNIEKIVSAMSDYARKL